MNKQSSVRLLTLLAAIAAPSTFGRIARADVPADNTAAAPAQPPRSDEGDGAAAGRPATNMAVTATADEAARTHANPRLKLSFRSFGLANLDGSAVPVRGAQLDTYPLSRRYVRVGLEAEAGAGDASLDAMNARLWYAMGGLSAGFQYPARVTPFVEGRFAAGALGGVANGSIPAGAGTAISVSNQSGATVLWLGGIDAGVEVYTFGRFYLSAALGWAHPTYEGIDYQMARASGAITPRAISSDVFTFKLGLGV